MRKKLVALLVLGIIAMPTLANAAEKLRVAFYDKASLESFVEYVAVRGGFFGEEGVDAEAVYLPNSEAIIAAFLQDQVDIVVSTFSANVVRARALEASEKGLGGVRWPFVVGQMTEGLNEMVARTDSWDAITGPVAVIAISRCGFGAGNSPITVTEQTLAEFRHRYGDDVRIACGSSEDDTASAEVKGGTRYTDGFGLSPKRLQAIVDGRAVAGLVNWPLSEVGVAKYGLHRLVSAEGMQIPYTENLIWVDRARWSDDADFRASVQAYLRAIDKAGAFIANPTKRGELEQTLRQFVVETKSDELKQVLDLDKNAIQDFLVALPRYVGNSSAIGVAQIENFGRMMQISPEGMCALYLHDGPCSK